MIYIYSQPFFCRMIRLRVIFFFPVFYECRILKLLKVSDWSCVRILWPKWLEYKCVHMRLCQLSVLKPESCQHWPITLDMRSPVSIYCPIICRYHFPKTQQQQTDAQIGVKQNYYHTGSQCWGQKNVSFQCALTSIL